MSLKRLAITAAIGGHGHLNATTNHSSERSHNHHYHHQMRPGSGINQNVNVLLGGAMLSVVITVVCCVCYCCHRTIKKRSHIMTYRYPWMETDPNVEIYSIDQRYDQSRMFSDQLPDSPRRHGPPPSYEAVVANDIRKQIWQKYSQCDFRQYNNLPQIDNEYCSCGINDSQISSQCLQEDCEACTSYRNCQECPKRTTTQDLNGNEEQESCSGVNYYPNQSNNSQILSPKHIIDRECNSYCQFYNSSTGKHQNCASFEDNEQIDLNNNPSNLDLDYLNNNCVTENSTHNSKVLNSANDNCVEAGSDAPGISSSQCPTSEAVPKDVNLESLHENGLIRMDMSKIIDSTGLPTYEAALRFESSGYV